MNRKTTPGFTIIELMITIAIGGILLTVAVPSFQTLIKNNRVTTQANLLIGDINMARSQAIKEGFNAFITATNAGDAANEFGPGWTVWIDRDADLALDLPERLRVTEPLDPSMTLDSVQNINQVQYLSSGLQPDAAGLRSFTLCDDRTAERGRQISISAVGRVSINSNFACP